MLSHQQRTASRAALKDVTILVVDDNEDARELIAVVLEREGAIVTQADSVPNALRAASRAPFRVLVSDIGMPVYDGYELIRSLRKSRAMSTIAAVAVSAFGEVADRQKAFAAGFQEHLVKPVNIRTLVDVVARLAFQPA